MPTKIHERAAYPFEQIALNNRDPRLTSHPQSKHVVEQYKLLQNPSSDGTDIPSKSLLFQLPYTTHHQVLEGFLRLCTETKEARQQNSGFSSSLIASPKLEAEIKRTASLLSKPFLIKERHQNGNFVELIMELDNKRSLFIPQVQIVMNTEFLARGVVRIVNLELRKKTRSNVSKINLLINHIEVLFDPTFQEDGYLPEHNRLSLSGIPLSLYQIVAIRHELGHAATSVTQSIDRFLGIQKMKFMVTHRETLHSLEDEEKCAKKLIHGLGTYGANWMALLEPLSIREAVAIYAAEVAASTHAAKYMEEVIEFFGLGHTSVLHEIELFLADALSSYLLNIDKCIGKSILPRIYQRLTEEEIKKLPLLKKMFGLALSK